MPHREPQIEHPWDRSSLPAAPRNPQPQQDSQPRGGGSTPRAPSGASNLLAPECTPSVFLELEKLREEKARMERELRELKEERAVQRNASSVRHSGSSSVADYFADGASSGSEREASGAAAGLQSEPRPLRPSARHARAASARTRSGLAGSLVARSGPLTIFARQPLMLPRRDWQ